MGFLEKQMRTVAFLMSVVVQFTLLYILIAGFKYFSAMHFLAIMIMMGIMMACIIGQAQLYKIPGYKYDLLTLPGVILACTILYFG